MNKCFKICNCQCGATSCVHLEYSCEYCQFASSHQHMNNTKNSLAFYLCCNFNPHFPQFPWKQDISFRHCATKNSDRTLHVAYQITSNITHKIYCSGRIIKGLDLQMTNQNHSTEIQREPNPCNNIQTSITRLISTNFPE